MDLKVILVIIEAPIVPRVQGLRGLTGGAGTVTVIHSYIPC